MRKLSCIAAAGITVALLTACATAPGPNAMSFFITSVGSGKGADLGGLAGADAHCQRLATAAGSTRKNWRAYLSTPPSFATATAPAGTAVHARDRIGAGPWFNVKGEMIARSVAHLHDGNFISKATALDERGNVIKGRGDTPNEHDILTGSRSDGTAFAPQTDTTCKAWTSSTDGSAVVGHHDLIGPTTDNWAKSWNFSHQSAGCSQEALIRTGGSGRFYCFAAN
ncbi:MAG: hypothetical protein Q8R59_13390 [Polaromonas sp.]|nr:hypothetical protein [Polaromonas sp.]